MKYPVIKARTVVFWALLLFYSFFIMNHFFLSNKEGATDMASMSPGVDTHTSSPIDASKNVISPTDVSNNTTAPQDLSGTLQTLKNKEEKTQNELNDLRKQIQKLENPASA